MTNDMMSATAPNETRSIMQRLKEDTRTLHNQAEDQPYMRDLVLGKLPREAFASALPLLREIRAIIEGHLAAHEADPAIAACFKPHHQMLRCFDRDIDFFFACPPKKEVPAVAAFRQLVETTSATDPVGLLGIFYVLEGSNMGAAILRKKVQEAYHLSESEGTASMDPHGNLLYARWKEFSEAMNGLDLSGEQENRIVEAAKQTFGLVGDLYRQVYAPAA